MSNVFELVFSLGGLCQTSYQIESRFGFHYHSPFDWIVSPLDSISNIIKDDGERFCDSIIVKDDGITPLCANYGVSYAHEFRRAAQAQVIIDRQLMLESKNKLIHKMSVMNELLHSGRRALFIRLSGHHDIARSTPYLKDDRICSSNDLNALCENISKKYPKLDFELAFVYFPQFTELSLQAGPLDSRIKAFQLPPDGGAKWRGNVRNWSRVFDAYEFQLDTQDGRARQFDRENPLDAQDLR